MDCTYQGIASGEGRPPGPPSAHERRVPPVDGGREYWCSREEMLAGNPSFLAGGPRCYHRAFFLFEDLWTGRGWGAKRLSPLRQLWGYFGWRFSGFYFWGRGEEGSRLCGDSWWDRQRRCRWRVSGLKHGNAQRGATNIDFEKPESPPPPITAPIDLPGTLKPDFPASMTTEDGEVQEHRIKQKGAGRGNWSVVGDGRRNIFRVVSYQFLSKKAPSILLWACQSLLYYAGAAGQGVIQF